MSYLKINNIYQKNKNDNTVIKAKIKKSHDQTNIDKYRGAVNISEYHLISKLIYRKINILKLWDNYIMPKSIDKKSQKQTNLRFWY